MKQTTQTVITILNPNFNSPPTKKHNFPATNVDLRWRSGRILSITSVAIFNLLNDLVRLCLFLDRLYLQNPPFSGLFLIFTSIHIILHNLCTLFYNFWWWWWSIMMNNWIGLSMNVTNMRTVFASFELCFVIWFWSFWFYLHANRENEFFYLIRYVVSLNHYLFITTIRRMHNFFCKTKKN
jgi:hypothetical protein